MNHPENHKTFIEHLEDLRKTLIKIAAVVAIVLPIAFIFADDAVQYLIDNSCPPEFSLHYFTPMEPLFVRIKVSLLMALFITLPYTSYVIWKFIVPALYPEERKGIKKLAFFSSLLFIAGSSFCFYFIIPAMMKFSISMQSEALEPTIGLSRYIILVGMMLLGFGVMFQLPILVFFLVLSGIIKLKTIKQQRAIVLIIILVLSALLTPPDIFSQIMMAIPTYLLFEISLIFAAVAIKSNKESLMFNEEDSSYTPTDEETKDTEDIEPTPFDDEANRIDYSYEDEDYSYKNRSKRKLRSGSKRAGKRYGRSRKPKR